MSSPLRLLLFETAVTFPHLSGLHKSQNTSMALKNVLLKIRNYFKIPWIWRKILILLFVWLAQWPKHFNIYHTAKNLFPTNMMLLKIPNTSAYLKTTMLVLLKDSAYWFLLLVTFDTKGHQ